MRLRLAALASVMALLALACGQKPGVHARGVGLLPGQLTGGTGGSGVPAPEASPSFDPATGSYIDPATGAPTGTVDTGTTGGTGVPGTSSGGSGPASVPKAGNSTGISPTKIIIGLHAPVTGAAPIRSDSFKTGRDLYWKHGNNGGPVRVHGRTVEVLFENDNYNPSTATQKCKAMAEGGSAHLLIGGAGTDQIYSCARYSKDRGIPYLSAGVVQNNLKAFSNYFALSMTYAQQGKLLADFIKANQNNPAWGCDGACDKVAMVVTNTANFDDAMTSFKAAYGNVTVIRPSKSDSGAKYGDKICDGPLKKFDVVFPLTSPTFFLEMAASPTAACRPQYVGVGISHGIDTVADTGCKSDRLSMDGSIFFSPTPAYRDTATKDPVFKKYGHDDLEWLLWGLMKTLHQMFEKAGKNLTRQGFIQAVQSSSFNSGTFSGIFPQLKYSPSNHFGASKVNVLQAVCEGSGGYYKTLKANAPPF